VKWPRLRRRRKERLHELGESEAYGRSYGERPRDVRIVSVEPRRPRYDLRVTGEHLRRRFEQLLDERRDRDGGR